MVGTYSIWVILSILCQTNYNSLKRNTICICDIGKRKQLLTSSCRIHKIPVSKWRVFNVLHFLLEKVICDHFFYFSFIVSKTSLLRQTYWLWYVQNSFDRQQDLHVLWYFRIYGSRNICKFFILIRCRLLGFRNSDFRNDLFHATISKASACIKV